MPAWPGCTMVILNERGGKAGVFRVGLYTDPGIAPMRCRCLDRHDVALAGRLLGLLGAINVGGDERAVGVVDLAILVLAPIGTLDGKIPELHDIGKKRLVRAVGDAKQIVEALRRCAVLIGMGDMPAEGKPAPGEVARAAHVEHAGIAVRSAQDQLLFLVLLELEDEIGGELVSRVLLPAQQRDLQQIEGGVAGFVQERVDERTDDGIVTRDVLGAPG